ncbi:mechanosensitive ion channel [Streptococcus hyovaginalis]|uniref:mechanosensitive ion channel n=2 Tax=Streptococcus hyovaginalis TaxID=149015 RepID=UPI003ADA1827
MEKFLGGIVMDTVSRFTESLFGALPGAIRIIVLILVALIVAALVKKLVIKGLTKLAPVAKLSKWGLVKPTQDEKALVKGFGQFAYFLVILFFLPAILSGLGVSSVVDPISSMFAKFFGFLPNAVAAGLILVVGVYLCKFVKNLVSNLLVKLPFEKWMSKLFDQDIDQAKVNEVKIADVLASIVYVLLFIPILTLALETLGIKSLSEPIVGLLDQVINFIPNILVSVVLLAIGGFIAKLLSNLLEKVLKASGIDKYSQYLSVKGQAEYQISTVLANIVSAIILVFFFVQALATLNLSVLNTIGLAIIAYLPAVISSLAILGLAIVLGNVLAGFIAKSTSSKALGEVVRYGLIALAIFMALDQLNIAQTIVQTTFTIILGAVAVAFALAFGLGGKAFAARQLEKLENFLNKK